MQGIMVSVLKNATTGTVQNIATGTMFSAEEAWRSPNSVERKGMFNYISSILTAQCNNKPSVWKEGIFNATQKIEDSLYLHAETLEKYIDKKTIRGRIEKIFKTNLEKEKNAIKKASSVRNNNVKKRHEKNTANILLQMKESSSDNETPLAKRAKIEH
jgi:hypothetical protein